jgi:hypothetical protein
MWTAGPWRAMNVLVIVLVIVLFSAAWPVRPVLTLLTIVSLLAASLALRLVRVESSGSRRGDTYPRIAPPTAPS